MAMQSAPSEGTYPELVLTRVLDAPRELVFKAWTDPVRLARWWGPKGFTNPRCEIDVRPGGAIRIDMRAPDGSVYPMPGTFREIAPPERLVFTSGALDGDGRQIFEILNTVTFAEEAGRTALTLRASVLWATPEAEQYLPGAKEGWTQSLERLAAEVSSAAADLELIMTRVFDAPRSLVFEAWTDPERLARWWGPRGFTNTVQELDARPGGTWRILQHGPDGRDHPFAGTFLEVVPPERIVHTQRYCVEPYASHEILVTVTLAERDGGTALTVATRFASPEDRDGMLAAGMERGMRQTFDRLAEHLAPLTASEREIVATRVFAAPRELVFRMWTEPQHVARWWGPRGFTTTVQQMDVRPGGVWRFVMHGPDGADYENEMAYSEVAQPERLVYTHAVEPRFEHEVSFTDLGDRTEVTVRMRFETAQLRDRVARDFGAVEGLNQTLDRLAELLASIS